jgi:hypothetical protein
MKQWLLLAAMLQAGCGSLTPELKQGTGFYSAMPQQNIAIVEQDKSLIKEPFQLRSLHGCFINSAEYVESDIIAPAIIELIDFNKAIAAVNVKATRDMTPTVMDAIFGAFIWGCSYWNVSGELVKKL